jgi:hypothetical protein
MQDDIGGDQKFLAAVIAGSVHKKQDQFLVIFLRQGLQKNLEAFGIGCRQDASSVLRADCAIQIDVFANELAGDLRPDADGCPAWSRSVHPTEPRFITEHDAQATAPLGGSPSGFPHGIGKIVFLKAF